MRLNPLRHRDDSTVSEIPELVVASMLRIVALSMFGIFVPLYLFGLGFGLPAIGGYYIAANVAKLVGSLACLPALAKYGPRHVMLLSNGALVLNLVSLILLDRWNIPLLVPALLNGLYLGPYFVALHSDFSASTKSATSTSSLGWYVALNQVAAVAGPLAGGSLATLYGAPVVLGIGVGILLASMLVLISVPEQARPAVPFRWQDLHLRLDLGSALANFGNNLDTQLATIVWPLLLGVVILGRGNYLGLGSIVAAGTLAGAVTAVFISRLADHGKARSAYTVGTAVSVIVHGLRAFVPSAPLAAVTHVVKEPSEMALVIPFTKGYYNDGDEHAAHRLAYFGVMEAFAQALVVMFWIAFTILALTMPLESALRVALVIGSALCLTLFLQRFSALRA